jgi:hypothetical protein
MKNEEGQERINRSPIPLPEPFRIKVPSTNRDTNTQISYFIHLKFADCLCSINISFVNLENKSRRKRMSALVLTEFRDIRYTMKNHFGRKITPSLETE